MLVTGGSRAPPAFWIFSEYLPDTAKKVPTHLGEGWHSACLEYCPLIHSSFSAEPHRGVPGALSSAAPEQREPSATACVHIPSPGVSYQHRLLQPLDRLALALVPCPAATRVLDFSVWLCHG